MKYLQLLLVYTLREGGLVYFYALFFFFTFKFEKSKILFGSRNKYNNKNIPPERVHVIVWNETRIVRKTVWVSMPETKNHNISE